MHPFTDHPFARAGHTLVSVIKKTVAMEHPVQKRRRLLMADIEGAGGASDLFAMEGPQETELVIHHEATKAGDIADRRPTTVADEFLFLFGGMSERGLGSSSTKGGLGPDPEYPKD